MRVTMLLCDAAAVADGKLFILGGGWSVVGPDPAPSAIALRFEADWNEADTEHHWELFLLNADGGEVVVDTVEGPRPVEVRGDFRIGRPAGLPEGSPADLVVAVNVGLLPLSPGSRFTWRLTIDGQSKEDWLLGFSTRPLIV